MLFERLDILALSSDLKLTSPYYRLFAAQADNTNLTLWAYELQHYTTHRSLLYLSKLPFL